MLNPNPKKTVTYMLVEIACAPILLFILWFIGTKPGQKILNSIGPIHM